MKYLNVDINDIPMIGDENNKERGAEYDKYERKWNEQYKKYQKEFSNITTKLPKNFLKEYNKHDFHDNLVKSIYLTCNNTTKRIEYSLCIELIDYYDDQILHKLSLIKPVNVKMNMSIASYPNYSSWLYCEILPAGDKQLSIEIAFCNNSVLYAQFSKLRYRKEKLLVTDDRN